MSENCLSVSPVEAVISFNNGCIVLMYFSWTAVATWRWLANDENCGICRMTFDGCCPDCKLPGDDCPLGQWKHLS